MGIVAKYLDQLTDAQRDRVIEADDWTDAFVEPEDPSCRCLCGHAEDYAIHNGCTAARDRSESPDGEWACMETNPYGSGLPIYNLVPHLFRRFGKAKIVRLFKVRAARGNRIHEIRAEIYEELTPREVMAWREGKARRLVPDGGMYGSTLITSGDTDA